MTAKQMDRLLDIVDRAVTVAERWADRDYPLPVENAEIEIYHQGQPDEPFTKEDYDAIPEDEGRFERKYRDANS